MNQGVDGGRIKTVSAGEDEASDTPKDWPTDRRVQIQLDREGEEMSFVSSRVSLGGALALLLLGGCHNKDGSPEPTSRASTHSANPPVTGDPDIGVLTIIAVDIDTKLAVMCGLPESKVFFKFDSAKLGPDAKARLQEIAACATSGAAKGEGPRRDRANGSGGQRRVQQTARHDARGSGREVYAGAGRHRRSRGGAVEGREHGHAKSHGFPYERRVTVRLQP